MDKNNKIWYKDEKERDKVLKEINLGYDGYVEEFAAKTNLSDDIIVQEIELALYTLNIKYGISSDNLEAVYKSFAKMWFVKMGVSKNKKQDSESLNDLQQYYAKEVANFTKELEKLNITDSQDLIDILPLIKYKVHSDYYSDDEKLMNEVLNELKVLAISNIFLNSSKGGENKGLKDYINEELDKIK